MESDPRWAWSEWEKLGQPFLLTEIGRWASALHQAKIPAEYRRCRDVRFQFF